MVSFHFFLVICVFKISKPLCFYFKVIINIAFKKKKTWDFPRGPVVGTSPSNVGGAGLTPGGGAGMPHALQPKNQSIKQKQYCNKFNKDFESGPHQKKKI